MERSLVIKGQLMGLNEYTRLCRGNKYAAAKAKKEIEDAIIIQCKMQLRGYKTYEKVHLSYIFAEKNMKRDKDNIASLGMKVIQDSLVKAGIMNDDGWLNIESFDCKFIIDKLNPHIEVTIKELRGDS